LYGQPTWWGESGADDHNKQLLKDMQRQKDQDKHTQKAIEEERSMYIPANQSNTDGMSTLYTLIFLLLYTWYFHSWHLP